MRCDKEKSESGVGKTSSRSYAAIINRSSSVNEVSSHRAINYLPCNDDDTDNWGNNNNSNGVFIFSRCCVVELYNHVVIPFYLATYMYNFVNLIYIVCCLYLKIGRHEWAECSTSYTLVFILLRSRLLSMSASVVTLWQVVRGQRISILDYIELLFPLPLK